MSWNMTSWDFYKFYVSPGGNFTPEIERLSSRGEKQTRLMFLDQFEPIEVEVAIFNLHFVDSS